MTTKYDDFGFLNHDWAEANVEGFTDLGSCCQQLLVLFPEIPHRCADIVKEDPLPVPAFVFQEGKTHYAAGGIAGGAAGGAALATVLLPGGGGAGYKPPASVDEPPVAALVAVLLVAAILLKIFR